ncbi:hypothetical protein GCM10009718_12960 [Isoptericola halotolerans]|uniref:Uncharacterized protein n=1 Tax=Isoptericola halotolerans TaxID=300560 RepID=A0ABX1ZZA0_9MICO|nr:hypothetical protein [Isoptericola halotolerans]NOV95784.1 hypothetical protein [Isoptericola halotolerans]
MSTATRLGRTGRTVGPSVILALALAIAACSPTSGQGELRADLEPLTDRFSALGTPVGATWASGTTGDREVPGPTTYWIDAVIQVDPAVAQALAAETSPVETTDAPDVVDALVPALPDGPLLTGPALDERFAESGFVTAAYLDVDDATLVLVALGE